MRPLHPLHRFLTALFLIILLPQAVGAAEDFPLRPYYPEVPLISTEDLMDQYDATIVVDIRSSFEYDVAHVNKAALLPLSDPDFADRLEALRPKSDPTPMVFYCNGHSCAKSYQAAQLAISLGFNQVYAYDGGIFDWITAAPERATLMGETPARADRIITTEKFGQRLIDYDDFSVQAMDANAIVIDIRDPFQRQVMPRIPGIRNIPLDPLLDLVSSRVWTEKRLLFFDAVGKQVRWLQYFLESYGYFDYAFLNKGVRGLGTDPGKVEPVIEINQTIVAGQEMLLTLTNDSRLDNSDRKVLSFLLANVKFNNYIVVDLDDAGKQLGMSRELLLSSVKKLTRYGYSTHSVMQKNLIVQVDPRLAWKGTVGGSAWSKELKKFDTPQGK